MIRNASENFVQILDHLIELSLIKLLLSSAIAIKDVIREVSVGQFWTR